jgi:hypothetical protein
MPNKYFDSVTKFNCLGKTVIRENLANPVAVNPDRNMRNAVHSSVRSLKDTRHLGRQMSHLSVQTQLDSFLKPASLR